ncbi:hypothetical protein AB0B25_10515 [Nocardia sp. NPDC049190]|uniref:hypothetical protein n=1 Tax=Nocardia sp. NPDC049190 TaxID=3155650 RepID=UPI003401C1A6
MLRKTSQEKKRLSYAKDRRNNYGENDKSSRKNIPLRKRLVNRANRRLAEVMLMGATGIADPVGADSVEQDFLGRRPKRWKKSPDIPLGIHAAGKRERGN